MRNVMIAGAGFIGRAHAEAARLLDGGARLMVADPGDAARSSFAAQFPEAETFSDVREMLKRPAEPGDIVVVATPPRSHAEIAELAFASGRHVLSDKPLGFDLDDGSRMLDAARRAGRHLGDSSNRFLGYASTERARDIVGSGALGEIYHATVCHRRGRMRSGIEYQPESRWFLDRARSGGGVLMDWGVYDLTTFFHVLQPRRVEVLQAWMRRPPTSADPGDVVFDVETHVGASLRLETTAGATVIVDYERASASYGSERMIMEVEGLAGAVRWDWIPWLKDGKADVAVRAERDGALSETVESFDLNGTLHFHHRPLVYFADALSGGTAPAVLDERALFGFAVVRTIYDVVADGRPRSVDIDELRRH